MNNTTGSIRSRGRDSWELRIYLGVDPTTRKERWATKTVRGSRRYATAQLTEFREVASNARVRSGSLAELLERWYQVAAPDWSATTLRETQSIVHCHLLPHLGHVPVAKLTTEDIDDFYSHLRRCGGRDGRSLSPGTVQRVHVVLHRALVQAVRWDWIWVNPAADASPPRPGRPEVRPPTAKQVSALLAHVRKGDKAFRLFLLLAATTGARRGELLALRWGDVDLRAGEIGFQRALVEGVDGPVLASTKTDRGHRVVLDGVTLEALRSHFDSKAKNGAAPANTAFLFASDRAGGNPWLPNYATQTFIRYRKAAGLPQFRLHDLRHFMASEMLGAGVPITVVSGRLAHARASTTLNVYAHAIPGSDAAAAETLARRLTDSPAVTD